MSSPFVSVCFTLLNRADFLKGKLKELREFMDYDPKKMEICVTDGGSTDGLLELLKSEAKHFQQVKYALSDRKALPFIIPENNPACDINAQICNVATHEIIVRTDAEARFLNPGSIDLVVKKLSENPELCMSFHCFHMKEEYDHDKDMKHHLAFHHAYSKMSFICSCFCKQAFIKNRGVHEEFAKGFAAEDSFFHNWWKRNRTFQFPPDNHKVVHLWHGKTFSSSRLKLKHEFSLPLYKRLLKENATPNDGNDQWQRPEMISNVQIFKGE